MWWRWLPWRYVIRRIARAHGFLDPLVIAARLQRFSQPSEVAGPIELLRAALVFHARGLINSRVIQHNRDWVWPFWVERQFDPRDPAFIPRAFSITHVNLTHRNWTAVGLPDCGSLPIVDPRGLLTPLWDGWSLDVWIIAEDGQRLLPSRAEGAEQRLELDELQVVTALEGHELALTTRIKAAPSGSELSCRLEAEACSARGGWLVLALRPYNPEGVSLVHEIRLDSDRLRWRVEGHQAVTFSNPVERHHASNYRSGDVLIHLDEREEEDAAVCEVGMATTAAMFRLNAGQSRRIGVRMDLENHAGRPVRSWSEALQGHCRLSLPDERAQFLYDAALRTLVLLSPDEVYAGPYTYRRFWFRDAAFILHSLLCVGLFARVERAIDHFPSRQARDGYFRSQDGEWDANGEVLWLIDRYCGLSGRAPKAAWCKPVGDGAAWLARKRLPEDGSPHAGLLPAGFSAEHLGPNDYYYWDDFWGIAGLEAAARLMERYDDEAQGIRWAQEALALRRSVERSIDDAGRRLRMQTVAASPYRRMDSAAVGSLVAGYPLQLFPAEDPRLLGTAEFLLENCLLNGGLYHDVVHSGVNVYLTLHLAQVLLRGGDPRHTDLMRAVARMASPTGQWPEAIHPRTGGGCMGDGQHAWAAAEWLMMIRNAFVREEADRLVVGSGLWPEWLEQGANLRFGPAPTAFGPFTVQVEIAGETASIEWSGAWRERPPTLEIAVPGSERVLVEGTRGRARVRRA